MGGAGGRGRRSAAPGGTLVWRFEATNRDDLDLSAALRDAACSSPGSGAAVPAHVSGNTAARRGCTPLWTRGCCPRPARHGGSWTLHALLPGPWSRKLRQWACSPGGNRHCCSGCLGGSCCGRRSAGSSDCCSRSRRAEHGTQRTGQGWRAEAGARQRKKHAMRFRVPPRESRTRGGQAPLWTPPGEKPGCHKR